MIEETAPITWVRFIPALPLFAAILHGLMIGLLRRSLSSRVAASITLGSVAAALLFSGLAFVELIGRPSGDAIVDRVATWIGVGVGSSALVVDLVLRFDALSAVMCLLVTGVGLLALIYALGDLRADTRDDRGEQRFFACMSLLLAAMLLLVLADDWVLLLAGWAGVGVATSWLLGFWYGDDERVRTATLAFGIGRLGDVALLGAFALIFWAKSDANLVQSGFEGLRDATPELAAATLVWPGVLGGGTVPLLEIVCILVLVALVTKAGQLPFTGWVGEAVGAPTAALVLIHTVTTVAAPIYLGARLAFLFAEAPVAASVMAWVGASTALVAALVACAQVDVLRVLAWSTASQIGYALVALGAAAPTAALYHLVAHAFHKSLIIMVMGVVIAAVGGERDVWRMGNLGSRLWRTRIDSWIAAVSIGGILPISVGFFSLEQVVGVAGGAIGVAGHGALAWVVLLAVAATGFYIVRLIYLVFYGETRIPSSVRWEEIEDPRPAVLWTMGLLAALSIGGVLIGMPQIWADLLFSDVENANSLQHFLSGSSAVPVESPLDPALEWLFAGRMVMMAALGALPAVWLYLMRPDWIAAIARRLAWLHRGLLHGMSLEPALRRLCTGPLWFLADRVLARGIEGPLVEGITLRTPARLAHAAANGWLGRLQSGSVLGYRMTLVIAGLGLLLYLLFGASVEGR